MAERLRTNVAGVVNVLSNAGATVPQSVVGAAEAPAVPLTGCSRLYQQIARHLASGAAVVVVDAQTPEQQLGASRALLEQRCDVLLTHDGSRRLD